MNSPSSPSIKASVAKVFVFKVFELLVGRSLQADVNAEDRYMNVANEPQ